MGWFDFFGGGGLADVARQGDQQQSLLQMLGLTGETTPPIVPNAQIPQAQQPDPWSRLAQWGAGVAKASAPSRMPVDFGQAMAGGADALREADDRALDAQLKQAQIGAEKAKGMPDLDAQAQQIMIKKQMGVPLTPQEQAIANTYDAFNTAKMQTVTMPDQSIRQLPAQRPIFGTPPVSGGGQQVDPRMQRLQQLRQMKQQSMGQ